MIVSYELNKETPITDEQKEEIKRLAHRRIEYDEDCPKTTLLDYLKWRKGTFKHAEVKKVTL